MVSMLTWCQDVFWTYLAAWWTDGLHLKLLAQGDCDAEVGEKGHLSDLNWSKWRTRTVYQGITWVRPDILLSTLQICVGNNCKTPVQSPDLCLGTRNWLCFPPVTTLTTLLERGVLEVWNLTHGLLAELRSLGVQMTLVTRGAISSELYRLKKKVIF